MSQGNQSDSSAATVPSTRNIPGNFLAFRVACRRRAVLYSLVGFLFGMLLTFGGYIADYISLYKTLPGQFGLGTLRALHIVTPVHYFTDGFALILGLVGGIVGWLQDKVLYYSGHLEDVVEERTRALRSSEERYALAARAANDGLWDWDLKADQVYYSPSWFRGLGEIPAARTGSIDDWIGRIHPDDKERFRARISNCLQGQSSQFEIEYRIRHADGSYRWMRARGMKDGQSHDPQRFAGWQSDVDHRRARARELRHKDGQAHDPQRFAGWQSDVDHRRAMESELMQLALHDSLTDLPNRTAFMERLGYAFERARRRNEAASLAVAFLDIDQFKHINESMGHLEGDYLLKTVARRIKQSLRHSIRAGQQAPSAQVVASESADQRLDWTLARTGGDEFAILIENIRSEDEAVQIIGAIQAAFQEPFTSNSHDLFVTVSAGIQFGPEGSERPDDLLRDADTAMYCAKARGRGGCEVFTRNMRSTIQAQLRTESELQVALRNEEFLLVYQPVVSLRNQKLKGFEALIRWNHPERGLLPPGEFIHLAEETGAIVEIGRWAIREAFNQLARWQEDHATARTLFISVNISRKQICDETLVSDISTARREADIDPKLVHLEITESLVLERLQESCAVLERLRDEGFKISIDDFGTGHSSLYTVQTLPADILKIDRSFVCQLGKSDTASRIVATIMALAKALGHEVIAEGVETEMQRTELERLGCRQSQGFLFYRPMPPSEIGKELFEQASRPTPSSSPAISIRP